MTYGLDRRCFAAAAAIKKCGLDCFSTLRGARDRFREWPVIHLKHWRINGERPYYKRRQSPSSRCCPKRNRSVLCWLDARGAAAEVDPRGKSLSHIVHQNVRG